MPPRSAASAQHSDKEEEWAFLLERLGNADESALAPLYDATSSIVYGVALHVLGETTAAEGVTVQTYMQGLRQAADYDPSRSRPSAWLRTVARSRAIDRLRARMRDRRLHDALVEHHADSSAPDVESHSLSNERSKLVRRALDSLPDKQREPLVLAYFGGLTHGEIAARLGEPLGTVKSRIRIGMTKLRSLLLELVE